MSQSDPQHLYSIGVGLLTVYVAKRHPNIFIREVWDWRLVTDHCSLTI